MIMEVVDHESKELRDFLEEDILRNYFILLGVTSPKPVYKKIYGQWEDGKLIGALFQRNSGNLQFYGQEGFDLQGFGEIINSMDYGEFIGPKSYCNGFLEDGIFSSYREGAYLSKLPKDSTMENIDKETIQRLKVEDLDRVVDLYEKVFPSFASKEVMERRLASKRGRGIYLEEDGKIICLAQSEFEVEDGALIVGVATDPKLQNRGLASKLLKVLCQELLDEGKNLYLQYDNLEAGKIYERLGFEIQDQVYHYER